MNESKKRKLSQSQLLLLKQLYDAGEKGLHVVSYYPPIRILVREGLALWKPNENRDIAQITPEGQTYYEKSRES